MAGLFCWLRVVEFRSQDSRACRAPTRIYEGSAKTYCHATRAAEMQYQHIERTTAACQTLLCMTRCLAKSRHLRKENPYTKSHWATTACPGAATCKRTTPACPKLVWTTPACAKAATCGKSHGPRVIALKPTPCLAKTCCLRVFLSMANLVHHFFSSSLAGQNLRA